MIYIIQLHLCRWYLDRDEVPRCYYVHSSISSSLRPHYLILLKESIWLVGKKSTVQLLIDNWLGTPLNERMNNPQMVSLIHLLMGIIYYHMNANAYLDIG